MVPTETYPGGAPTPPDRITGVEFSESPGRQPQRLARIISLPKITDRSVDSARHDREMFRREDSMLGGITGAYLNRQSLRWGWGRWTTNGEVTISTNLVPQKTTAKDEATDSTGTTHTTGDIKKITDYALAPAGAKIIELDEFRRKKALEGFKHWRRIEIDFTGVSEEEGKNMLAKMASNSGAGTAIELDERLLQPFPGPFSYEIIAEPLTPEEIEAKKVEAGSEFDDREPNRNGLKEDATDADIHDVLHSELLRDVTQGRFRTAIVVGTEKPEDIDTITSIITGAASNSSLPYRISTTPAKYSSYEAAVEDRPDSFTTKQEEDNYRKAYKAFDPKDVGVSAQMLRRFLALPSGELNGVGEHMREPYAVNTGFEHMDQEDLISVGEVEDRTGRPAGDLSFPVTHLDKHVGVWAASGAGKSTALRLITTEAASGEHKRPVLFVDPKGQKAGQPSNAEILADMLPPDVPVTEINPSDLLKEGGGLNPMDPGKTPLPEYVNDLVVVLANSFGSTPGEDDNLSAETTVSFLSDAIKGKRGSFKGVYERFGWNINTGEPLIPGSNPVYPTLWDLIDVAMEAAETQEYVGEGQNIKPFLERRQYDLNRGISGRFFDAEPMSTDKLYAPDGGVTVLNISGLSEKDQVLIMGLVVLKTNGHLKYTPDSSVLLVLDEINKLVKPGPLTDSIGNMVATNRQFNGGMVMAGQVPEDVPKQMRENINTHLVMRMKGADGAEAIRMPTRITTAQRDELVTYDDREIIMLAAGMQQPVRGVTHESSDKRQGEVKPPSSKFEKPPAEGHRLSDKEKIDLRRILDDTLEGGKLLGLADTTTVATVFGLGPVGIDFERAREEGHTFFDELSSRPESERTFLVRQAAERCVYSRSQKLLRADMGIEEYVQIVEQQLHSALKGEEIRPVDPNYIHPKYRSLPVKAELTEFISTSEVDERQLPRHPRSEDMELFLGRRIPGESAGEQIDYVNDSGQNTQLLMLSTNSRSGGFIIDRAVGIDEGGRRLERAINEHADEAWMYDYVDFLNLLDMSDKAKATIINEVDIHRNSEARKRDDQLARLHPKPEVIIQQEAPQVVFLPDWRNDKAYP